MEIEMERALDFMTEVAASLMSYGSPTTRTEIWVTKIGQKLGFQVDIAIIYTVIYITIRDKDGNFKSITKRLFSLPSDFEKFMRVDTLVKKFVDGNIQLAEAHIELKKIINDQSTYSIFLRLIAAALTCGGFEYVLVGGTMSAIASMVLGAVVYAATNYVKLLNNRFFQQFTSGIMISIGAWLLVHLFKGSTLSGVVSGSIMLFVPGLLITNGFSEISQASVISGTIKESEAMALLIALVFGIFAGTVFVGGMNF